MKKLSKVQMKKHAELADTLDKAAGALSDALGAWEEAWSAAKEFAAEIHDAQEYWQTERAEAWQESDKGIAYQSWMESWDEIVGLEGEIELDPDPSDVCERFRDLPEEVEG